MPGITPRNRDMMGANPRVEPRESATSFSLRTLSRSTLRQWASHLRTGRGCPVSPNRWSSRPLGIRRSPSFRVASSTVRASDFKGLTFLRDKVDDRFALGVVLYTGTTPLPFGDRLWALPYSSLWTTSS